MIVTFGDKATESLYHGREDRWIRRFSVGVRRVALRKLDMLDAAQSLQDLRSPPGNRLEPLKGRWQGFYSIRINEQWRIVFRWLGVDVYDVRIVDYH